MSASVRIVLAISWSMLLALGVFAVSGPVAPAAAAILPPRFSEGLLSAQIDGSAIYWFERTPVRNDTGGGRILRRDLVLDGETDEIFGSADGFEISGFRAAHGRVAIAQFNPTNRESRVLELKQQGGNWPVNTLMTRNATPTGDTCWAKTRLITINPAAEVIVDDLRGTGRNGKCTVQRPQSTLSAIASAGTSRTLLERKGSWGVVSGNEISAGTIGKLIHGAGEWLFSREPDEFLDQRAALLNIENGQTTDLIESPELHSRPEISTQGQMLVNSNALDSVPKLYTNPLNLAEQVPLIRRNQTAWFHLCGEKILEISRREAGDGLFPPSGPAIRQKRRIGFPSGSRWNLWILNMNGQRERRLPERLRRGTGFEACDAGRAVFHRYLRRGARQFSVPLG